MKKLPLIGMFRVGTNYTRTLLELNYKVEVVYDEMGWKHGLIPTYSRDSNFYYPHVAPLVVLKSPWSTLVSWFEYSKKNKKNLVCSSENFTAFLNNNILFRDDFSPLSPEYYFKNPVEMWNGVVWNHTSFVRKMDGLIIRYEDLLSSPKDVCEKIADYYSLERKEKPFHIPETVTKNMGDRNSRNHEEDYLTNAKFDKKDYFLNESYMGLYSQEDKDFVSESLVDELVKKYGYAMPNRGRSSDYCIYTMANDGRVHDLIAFLESNASFDNVIVKVIPFDDDVTLTRKVCSSFGAELVDVNPLWDKLGKSIYNNEDYRVNAPAWRYFRKFNALDSHFENFVFLDANTVITNSLYPLISGLGSCDFVFGSRSMKNRNFTPWAKYVLNSFDPYLQDGFNAGFWIGRKGVLNHDFFESLCKKPNIRKMLTKSPEQSVLSMSLVLNKANVSLVDKAVATYANLLSADNARFNEALSVDDGKVKINDKLVFAIKWTGMKKSGAGNPRISSFFVENSKKGLAKIKENASISTEEFFEIERKVFSKISELI